VVAANRLIDGASTIPLERGDGMAGALKIGLAVAVGLAMAAPAWAAEPDGTVQEKAQDTLDSAKERAGEVARSVDASAQAQEVSAGVLRPIYRLAEAFSFPTFHWIAFAVMVAGVVSFALQLTVGKLIVLSRLGFSPSEVLSDALGLVVSLVGLVLTTQAAAENSNFTTSAAAVLSATAVGAIAGFIFYLWGQRQELQAVEGRKRTLAAKIEPKEK
jgi:hypothetical protein